MPYSNFDTLEQVVREFSLIFRERQRIFADVEEIQPSQLLREILEFNIPLAVAIASEKARSELIVAPILLEVKRRHPDTVSLFSGRELNVDPNRGLSGYVDFLISKSPIQVFVDTPVIAVVEAKRDNLQSGYGQCVATMVAAQLKNQQEGKAIEKMLSVVTTGSLWQFFVLSNSELILDLVEYSVSEISRILGIFECFVIS
jgi:hypothetical protein